MSTNNPYTEQEISALKIEMRNLENRWSDSYDEIVDKLHQLELLVAQINVNISLQMASSEKRTTEVFGKLQELDGLLRANDNRHNSLHLRVDRLEQTQATMGRVIWIIVTAVVGLCATFLQRLLS